MSDETVQIRMTKGNSTPETESVKTESAGESVQVPAKQLQINGSVKNSNVAQSNQAPVNPEALKAVDGPSVGKNLLVIVVLAVVFAGFLAGLSFWLAR